ncbi:hypothetical protein [Methanobrevibacter sp.]|uniref:hypothetical protein n=1 Tax=Methanobrevibacter sp. TaxID=66852 RepID=UPI003862FDB3
MSDEEKKTFQEKVEEAKESSRIKREERILKMEEKKSNAKIKVEEKKLARKQEMTERKLEAHINLAEIQVEDALEDADVSIAVLEADVEYVIENELAPVDLVLFKASNILEEILLRTQLRIQVAKNELIANLQQDLGDVLEVAMLEENIAELKEKSDHLIGTLEGKIATEKDEFNEKYGDES